MNKIVRTLMMFFVLFAFIHQADAQLWKRIKKEVKTRVENHVVNDAGNVADKAVDKTENTAIKAVRKKNKQQAGETEQPVQIQSGPQPKSTPVVVQTTPPSPALPTMTSYKNYDFVPGDRVIFQTDFASQKDAELPARLGTLRGNVEIQTYKGEKILHIEKGDRVCIIPMTDSANYLPGQFTIEFDFLYNDPNPRAFNQIEVGFYKKDKKTDYIKSNSGDYRFLIYEAEQIDFGPTISGKELQKNIINDLSVPNAWHHVAIYVHNNAGKSYIDQYRVGATNMMAGGATKMAIRTNGRMEYLIKNLRIAGGGSDAYHKIMTDGKLVTHGIHFASGKADILPESMGTINEVYHILEKHSDLKLEIDGYTDSDGSDDVNLKLSQERADAVKTQLTGMGIDASRMTTKGLGEQNPIENNDTPEGKANNRRVEFVKK